MSNAAISPLSLAAHDISHLIADPDATGIRADSDGWTVMSATGSPPTSGDDFLNRHCAGIIGEIVLKYGADIGAVMARQRTTWQTEIGAHDCVILNHVPIATLCAVYDRCAPLINTVLTDIGRVRLTAIGHHLLQMSPGETFAFSLEETHV